MNLVQRLLAASRRRLIALALRGDRVACPLCERRYRRFQRDPAGYDAFCPRCGSRARHRVLWLALERSGIPARPGLRVLHMAPEHGLEARLRALPGVRYLSADLAHPRAMEHFDLEEIPHEDAGFDLVVCSHVLEHVADDDRAIGELRRVTAPGGDLLVMVPFDPTREATLEDPAVVAAEERRAAYWAEDHVRLYGRDLTERLAAPGFAVEMDRFAVDCDEATRARYGLRRDEVLFRCRPTG
ncbi:MAG: SAM-dependent methyltransferase [Solirubrobacterales bacterium]|nr:SAM-dependent methyltransferase [Solirubrobacterales bacterium]